MRRVAAPIASLIAAMIAAPASADDIDGTATYLARIAMPPGALLEVSLVARDAPGAPLARHRTAEASAPPYAFSLTPPEAAGDPAALALSATLRLPDGGLAFVGKAPVPDAGAAEIIMHRASPPEADAALVGPLWRLAFLNGDGVGMIEGQRDIPYLVFGEDGRVAGTGGCNRLVTGYRTASAGGLHIEQAASTMMACAEAVLDREMAFTGALARVTDHAIAGDVLTLGAEGETVAILVAETAP